MPQSRFVKALQLGFKSLLLHKLRSGLAILGIFIGVTAVIWLVAMGEGVSYQAQQQIKDLGATNIIVRNVKPPQEAVKGGRWGLNVQVYGLLRDDYDRIIETIPAIQQAVPMREMTREARHLDRKATIRVVGCTPEYLEINNLKMERGRFLTDQDGADQENCAVIASGAAEELFKHEDPIGQTVQIDKDFYVIVGQIADRMPTGNIGGSFAAQDYNLDIYVPLSTLRYRIGDTVNSRPGSRDGETVELSQITVTVNDIENVDETAEIIRGLLESTHTTVDYAITVPKELLRQAAVLQMMFNVLLVLIAGIALLVGGIGIMNIMLATVTERTREIGIRRALGAKRRDIVQQFLSETIVLSAAGGLLGVFTGFLCEPFVATLRWTARRLLPDLVNSLPTNIQNLEPRIATWSVAASFLISVGVGVVFGLYPRSAPRGWTPSKPCGTSETQRMKMAAQVIDVKKEYRLGGGIIVSALRGVSFDVPEGDFVAIMGQSGSGKSTMLNLLGCLDRPSSGKYILAGQDVSKLDDDALSDIRSHFLGFIFQSYNLVAQLTVVENIELPLQYQHGRSTSAADHKRCLELAELVGLKERLHHRPSQLSGGQQQRVAIARALINDPQVILADEPTGNLDTATGDEIMGMLQSLNRAGKTIIMVTHESDIAAQAHRTVRMRDGLMEHIDPYVPR